MLYILIITAALTAEWNFSDLFLSDSMLLYELIENDYLSDSAEPYVNHNYRVFFSSNIYTPVTLDEAPLLRRKIKTSVSNDDFSFYISLGENRQNQLLATSWTAKYIPVNRKYSLTLGTYRLNEGLGLINGNSHRGSTLSYYDSLSFIKSLQNTLGSATNGIKLAINDKFKSYITYSWNEKRATASLFREINKVNIGFIASIKPEMEFEQSGLSFNLHSDRYGFYTITSELAYTKNGYAAALSQTFRNRNSNLSVNLWSLTDDFALPSTRGTTLFPGWRKNSNSDTDTIEPSRFGESGISLSFRRNSSIFDFTLDAGSGILTEKKTKRKTFETSEELRLNKLVVNSVQRMRITDSIANAHTNLKLSYSYNCEWRMSNKIDLYWLNNGDSHTIKNYTTLMLTKGNFNLSGGPLLLIDNNLSTGIHLREKLEIKRTGELNIFFESIPVPILQASISWYI